MNHLTAYLADPKTRRILSKRPGQQGFSLIELVVVIAVLAILAAIALPRFGGITDDATVSAAKKALADAYTQCEVQRARQVNNPTINIPVINGGAFNPNGVGVSCTTNPLIFTPTVVTNPIFNISLVDGTKTCSRAVLHGCSAVTNGTW